jgi:hypothetical protein
MPWSLVLLASLLLGACTHGPVLVDRGLERGTALPPPELQQPVAAAGR